MVLRAAAAAPLFADSAQTACMMAVAAPWPRAAGVVATLQMFATPFTMRMLPVENHGPVRPVDGQVGHDAGGMEEVGFDVGPRVLIRLLLGEGFSDEDAQFPEALGVFGHPYQRSRNRIRPGVIDADSSSHQGSREREDLPAAERREEVSLIGEAACGSTDLQVAAETPPTRGPYRSKRLDQRHAATRPQPDQITRIVVGTLLPYTRSARHILLYDADLRTLKPGQRAQPLQFRSDHEIVIDEHRQSLPTLAPQPLRRTTLDHKPRRRSDEHRFDAGGRRGSYTITAQALPADGRIPTR